MKANPFARSATIATLTVYALAEGRQCVGEVTGTGRFTSHGAYPRGVDPEQPEQPELLGRKLTGDHLPAVPAWSLSPGTEGRCGDANGFPFVAAEGR